MKKWLFQSQDFFAFLFGGIFGFGINLVTGKLTELSIYWAIFSSVVGILGFLGYKYWIGSQDEFEFYIRHGKWEKKIFDSVETWTCVDTDAYQLVVGSIVVDGFKEEWTKIFPDNEHNSSQRLFLKRNGITVREFTWVSCDGGRVWIPIPDSRNLGDWRNGECVMEYSFSRNSLKFLMLEKLGSHGNETSFDRFFERAKIKLL